MNWPREWKNKNFLRCIDQLNFDRSKQVQANAYLKAGKYPVVDQGQDLIAGWTNDESTIIRQPLPLIIFGDHTRVFKYVDFPFAIGADGTKPFKANEDELILRFLYYHLLSLNIPSKGYSRHFKILKEQHISYPPLSEQRKIAAVLFRIQKAIELQDAIIEKTRELKKSTMEFVFTHGLRGEKTKMTEIGEMPESWEVQPLRSLVAETELVDVRNDGTRQIKYLDVSGVSNEELAVTSTAGYLLRDAPGRARKVIKKGDVVFATVRPTLRRIACIGETLDNQVCSTAFCVLRAHYSETKGRFVFYLVQRPQFIEQLAKIETGASYPAVTDKQVKSQPVPVPSGKEQLDIAEILRAVDYKCVLNVAKKTALQDLFKTMLNKLMSGELRVKDLEIDLKEVEK